jgi:hypothetical protein
MMPVAGNRRLWQRGICIDDHLQTCSKSPRYDAVMKRILGPYLSKRHDIQERRFTLGTCHTHALLKVRNVVLYITYLVSKLRSRIARTIQEITI